MSLFLAVVGGLLMAASPAWAGDLALNRPASASSTERGLAQYAPEQANDGDSGTRWSSAYVDNQWWEVDLGSDRTINRVELNWEVAYASRYRIRTRESGSSAWSTAADVSVDSPGLKVHTFAPRTARYVRIQGDARGTPWGISLWDARVCDNGTCGAPAPEPTPTPTPTPTPAPGWTFCSNEYERCSFSGTKQVRYGANTTWTTPREFTNGVDCSNQVFGDPLPGVIKRCEIRDVQPSTPPPTPTPTPEPSPSAPTLTEVDGGPAYYGRFSNPLPTSPSFFPIGVWGSYNNTQANRDLDAAAGINTYVWVDSTYLSQIRMDGRFQVIQSSEARTGVGTETKGWLGDDEADMQCGAGPTCWGQMESILNSLPADGKLRYNNYGKGIVFWQNDSDAQTWVNGRAGYGPYQHVISDDIYWFNDNDACTFSQGGRLLLGRDLDLTQAQCRRAANYGATVDEVRRLDAMDGKRMPVWNFVESVNPFTGAWATNTINGEQVRAAVWHSIIAGARGIIYFQHAFAGPCGGDHHTIRTNCNGTRPAITATNAQIRDLAPVLNAPTVTSQTTTSSGVRALYKWHDGHFYVFAGNRNNVSTTGTMGLSCVGSATAVKLGEDNERIAVVGGTFMDEFANGNAIHVYRIDGGSRCGL